MAKSNELETMYTNALNAYKKALSLIKENRPTNAISSLMKAKAIANDISYYADMSSEFYTNSQTLIRCINTHLNELFSHIQNPINKEVNF